jgi:hypothetical protein
MLSTIKIQLHAIHAICYKYYICYTNTTYAIQILYPISYILYPYRPPVVESGLVEYPQHEHAHDPVDQEPAHLPRKVQQEDAEAHGVHEKREGLGIRSGSVVIVVVVVIVVMLVVAKHSIAQHSTA